MISPVSLSAVEDKGHVSVPIFIYLACKGSEVTENQPMAVGRKWVKGKIKKVKIRLMYACISEHQKSSSSAGMLLRLERLGLSEQLK